MDGPTATTRWATAEKPAHFANRLLQDARQSAPPTRVNGGHGAAPRVGDEHRKAVGASRRKQDTALVGQQRIARFWRLARAVGALWFTFRAGPRRRRAIRERTASRFDHPMDFGRVDLLQRGEEKMLGIDALEKPLAVLFHVGAAVALGEAQV